MGSEAPETMKNVGLKLHGIQLNYLGVKELHFDTNKLARTVKFEEFEDSILTSGHTPYDPVRKTISVIAKVEAKHKTDSVHLRAELFAEFRVDENVFPAARVEEWAMKGAFYVLFPYLREHFQALCIRSGLPEIGLPLVEIPTFRVTLPTPIPAQQPQEVAAGSN